MIKLNQRYHQKQTLNGVKNEHFHSNFCDLSLVYCVAYITFCHQKNPLLLGGMSATAIFRSAQIYQALFTFSHHP